MEERETEEKLGSLYNPFPAQPQFTLSIRTVMASSISQRRTIGFPNAPPAPLLGFGFNLAPALGHPTSPNAASLQSPPRQPAPPTTLVRNHASTSTKRRYEPEAEVEVEDETMGGRSPSPSDRPQKGPPKRVRVDDRKTNAMVDAKSMQEQQETDSIDTGVLLGELLGCTFVVAHY